MREIRQRLVGLVTGILPALLAALFLCLPLSALAEKGAAPKKKKPAPVAAKQHKDPQPAKPPRPKSPPELLFTFDDGPHLERTPKVLKVLDEHHVKAVFFVNGVHFQGTSASAERARVLLRDTEARGHTIGNHTVNHLFLCGKRGPRVAEQEIELNAKLIEQAIGHKPALYRTPYGAHCATLSATLGKLGIKHTGWDIDPQDWKVQNTVKVRDYVEHWLHDMKSGRQILLMHDIHQDTVEALPQILDWLDKENAERAKKGEPQIKVIDPSYLLHPRAAEPTPAQSEASPLHGIFPLVGGVGRILTGTLPTPVVRAVVIAFSPLRA